MTQTPTIITIDEAKALAAELVNSIDCGGIDVHDAVILALTADGADTEMLRNARAIVALAYALGRAR